ncbi:MAG: hypothetical protein ACREQ7_12000 [Candidatus Binatia bacterium]
MERCKTFDCVKTSPSPFDDAQSDRLSRGNYNHRPFVLSRVEAREESFHIVGTMAMLIGRAVECR